MLGIDIEAIALKVAMGEQTDTDDEDQSDIQKHHTAVSLKDALSPSDRYNIKQPSSFDDRKESGST